MEQRYIETKNLILRPMLREDFNQVVLWRNKEHINTSSLEKKSLSLEEHKKWYEETRKEREDFIISVKSSKTKIACVSYSYKIRSIILDKLNFKKNNKNRVESSRYIGESSYLGKGYGQEAAAAFIQYIFEQNTDVDEIVALTLKNNIANIRINQKLGYTNICEFNDWWIMVLLKKNFINKSRQK